MEPPRRAGTCERPGAATGFRARQRLLTQRRDLKCGIRAQKPGQQTQGLELLPRSFNFLYAIHGARRDGDVRRCAVPLSTFCTFFVVWSTAETVGFLVCPVWNQQIEVLLAESKSYRRDCFATYSGESTLHSGSGIQCVLDF